MLSPAVRLMQRLRLLPKFLVVSAVFLLPLLLATGFLMTELQRSIAATRLERTGVDGVLRLAEIGRLARQHRALEHLRLAGKQQVDSAALARQLTARLDELARWRADGGAAVLAPNDGLARQWDTLRRGGPQQTAKASFAQHSALIAHTARLAALVADSSGLSADAAVGTHRLIRLFASTFPDTMEQLSVLAARGGAYIDSGLLEANEDQLLNATAMLARHALEQVPDQLAGLAATDPAFAPWFARHRGAVPAALAFLDRARNEVANTVDQTSGAQFNAAGAAAIDGLHDVVRTAGAALDTLLAQRAVRDVMRRNLVLAALVGAIALAAWLYAGLYRSFARDIGALHRAVHAAAAGDLSVRIASPARDELGSLTNAFDDTLRTLAGLMANVRRGAGRIGSSADGLATGNAGLSEQTDAQARALAQTVVSMRELADAVQRNAVHVQDGGELASTAGAIAARSGHDVQAVIQIVRSMRAGSQRIADIIGVIDGIAFQTNILALNAAVEAARAGPQGRGFAVVASEVRNLAQRCAAAALEIKQLIAASVTDVQQGSTRADTASRTTTQLLDAVQRMTDVLARIRAVEGAQRSEIAALNDALERIEQMNRRNAELTASAAEGASRIHGESALLNEALRRFKLSSQHDGEQRGALTT
jgi:methyl-accepting chemotaxis protein